MTECATKAATRADKSAELRGRLKTLAVEIQTPESKPKTAKVSKTTKQPTQKQSHKTWQSKILFDFIE
jgi:hypothetical protein